jgi:hypothetical protein
MTLLSSGESGEPYEQRLVMRSTGVKFPQRAGLTVERCA